MCFEDFAKGHSQTLFSTEFSEVFPLINYDLDLQTVKMKRNKQPQYYFAQTWRPHCQYFFFFKFNKVAVLFSSTFLSIPLLKLLTGIPAQLCSQIMLVPFGKTSGRLKFPGFILINNSVQGSFHTELHHHTRSHTHTEAQRNTHRTICQDILPGGGSMPSMSLALRLDPAAHWLSQTHTHTH